MDSSRFPIMGDKYGTHRGYVPMSFARRFEANANRNHGQSIMLLADRGGLSPAEFVAVMQGVRFNSFVNNPDALWANIRIVVSAEFPYWNFTTGVDEVKLHVSITPERLAELEATERKLQAVRESLAYCKKERSELIATDFDQSKGMEVVIEEIERALGTP